MSETQSPKQRAAATGSPGMAHAREADAGSRLPESLLNLEGLGRALVQLRVRSGISQRELARRTGVHESQVSRDEKGAYGNATVGRLQRIIEALDGRLISSWEPPPPD
jgi:DNA-directed RNA polymerase specialized sigma subunit